MSPIGTNIANVITAMTKPDAIAPIIALETTVVGGRTGQAYKRGGKDEARERFIEEATGSVVWLCGVKVLNDLGDIILKKIFKSDIVNFDVGTDKILRTPFENYMKKVAPKGFTKTGVATLKGLKVLSSIIIANLFIGFAVPKINHALTNRIRGKKENSNTTIDTYTSSENSSKTNTSFKGAMSAINTFTNAIENTNTGKLLSTDIGIAGGRMINARNREERREIGIRDLGSIYFYMWAPGHVRNLLNYVETGSCTRLDPATTEILNKHIIQLIEKHSGEMSIEEFKEAMLGKNASEIKIPDGINFETGKLSKITELLNKTRKIPVEPLQVAKVSDIEKIISDTNLLNRIKEMSKLQPLRMGEAVITKQQIIDAINDSHINDPKFLDKVFSEYTNGASKDELKYISNSKLYQLKTEMEKYVERLCKNAKEGKINKDLVNKAKHKNIIVSGINFLAGFAVAALFLSTLIPKFQYFITKRTTGFDEFPGTYDEETIRRINSKRINHN